MDDTFNVTMTSAHYDLAVDSDAFGEDSPYDESNFRASGVIMVKASFDEGDIEKIVGALKAIGINFSVAWDRTWEEQAGSVWHYIVDGVVIQRQFTFSDVFIQPEGLKTALSVGLGAVQALYDKHILENQEPTWQAVLLKIGH